MTRKHFVALANKIAGQYPVCDSVAEFQFKVDQWERTLRAVADSCAESNPRFDRERFIAACHGYTSVAMYRLAFAEMPLEIRPAVRERLARSAAV